MIHNNLGKIFIYFDFFCVILAISATDPDVNSAENFVKNLEPRVKIFILIRKILVNDIKNNKIIKQLLLVLIHIKN